MSLRTSAFFGIFTLLVGMMGCTHESMNPDPDFINPVNPVVQDPPCDPNLVYFEQDVLPLLQSSCGYAGCHDVATAEDGVILVSYESVMGSKGGDLVSAGNPQNSELYEVLVEDNPNKLMPPPDEGGPLSQDQIDLIYGWIEQGALNNSCADCDSTLASYSGAIELTLAASCTSCHSGANPDGQVDLTSHAGVVNAVTNRNLLGCIRHDAYAEAMPPSGNPLTDCQIQQFQHWIDAGMPND
ncbi:MAG: hypothetical protein O3B70_06570 [Bacteroidetes bacterium]|nr:hypothetical protein [Bacteroidota bacterium]MDA0903982.1 hypothetical protein [Bacteroidota bacterium]MDA1243162.1 hypothetical protein [Bacteroidota bacterium]